MSKTAKTAVNVKLLGSMGPFPFLFGLLTISPKYLNELISTLDLLLWCTKWNEWSVFLSFQLLNLIITHHAGY